MDTPLDPAGPAARAAAAALVALPGVVAVALGGSRATGTADAGSDVDLYVYAEPEPPLSARAAAAAAAGARRLELGNRAFEPGDEWLDGATGVHVDAMYRSPAWIEAQLDRVLVRHEPSTGYSTCLWHNVLVSVPLRDPSGWYARLRVGADVPYPEPLRRAVVARNHPLLRGSLSSYRHQLERALARGDEVAAQHRSTAFLASWFDVLFAVNRRPHPGEKRLLALAEALCPLRPPALARHVEALVAACGTPAALPALDALCAGLDEVLRSEGLLPP
jgi:hypothetical protein